jgi:hypothetical protein
MSNNNNVNNILSASDICQDVKIRFGEIFDYIKDNISQMKDLYSINDKFNSFDIKFPYFYKNIDIENESTTRFRIKFNFDDNIYEDTEIEKYFICINKFEILLKDISINEVLNIDNEQITADTEKISGKIFFYIKTDQDQETLRLKNINELANYFKTNYIEKIIPSLPEESIEELSNYLTKLFQNIEIFIYKKANNAHIKNQLNEIYNNQKNQSETPKG